MPTINQLPVLSTISSGDQLARLFAKQWGCSAHVDRQFADIFPAEFCIANVVGESLCAWQLVSTLQCRLLSVNDQWMLLQPAGTLATGTITLPLNTGVPDGTTVLITTTQEITSLTIALNGASAIYGGVSFLGAGTATAIRFYQPTNSWYQINAETVYAAGVYRHFWQTHRVQIYGRQ
jgi:hypothetical protein